MKEKLIAYFEHKLRQMDINPTVRNVYFDQAFGALDFAMRLTDDEPADIDDDCGFDPYEGCYIYDC